MAAGDGPLLGHPSRFACVIRSNPTPDAGCRQSYYPHFADGNTEVHREQVTWPVLLESGRDVS